MNRSLCYFFLGQCIRRPVPERRAPLRIAPFSLPGFKTLSARGAVIVAVGQMKPLYVVPQAVGMPEHIPAHVAPVRFSNSMLSAL